MSTLNSRSLWGPVSAASAQLHTITTPLNQLQIGTHPVSRMETLTQLVCKLPGGSGGIGGGTPPPSTLAAPDSKPKHSSVLLHGEIFNSAPGAVGSIHLKSTLVRYDMRQRKVRYVDGNKSMHGYTLSMSLNNPRHAKPLCHCANSFKEFWAPECELNMSTVTNPTGFHGNCIGIGPPKQLLG